MLPSRKQGDQGRGAVGWRIWTEGQAEGVRDKFEGHPRLTWNGQWEADIKMLTRRRAAKAEGEVVASAQCLPTGKGGWWNARMVLHGRRGGQAPSEPAKILLDRQWSRPGHSLHGLPLPSLPHFFPSPLLCDV